jgi:hypothetical protein
MFLVSHMTSPMPLSCTSGNHDCHIATVIPLYYLYKSLLLSVLADVINELDFLRSTVDIEESEVDASTHLTILTCLV